VTTSRYWSDRATSQGMPGAVKSRKRPGRMLLPREHVLLIPWFQTSGPRCKRINFCCLKFGEMIGRGKITREAEPSNGPPE